MLESMEDRALSWDHWFLDKQVHHALVFLKEEHPDVYSELEEAFPDDPIFDYDSYLRADLDPEEYSVQPVRDAIEGTGLIGWLTDQPWDLSGMTDEELDSLYEDIEAGKL